MDFAFTRYGFGMTLKCFSKSIRWTDHNNVLNLFGLFQCAQNVDQQRLVLQEQECLVVVLYLNTGPAVTRQQNGVHFFKSIHYRAFSWLNLMRPPIPNKIFLSTCLQCYLHIATRSVAGGCAVLRAGWRL